MYHLPLTNSIYSVSFNNTKKSRNANNILQRLKNKSLQIHLPQIQTLISSNFYCDKLLSNTIISILERHRIVLQRDFTNSSSVLRTPLILFINDFMFVINAFYFQDYWVNSKRKFEYWYNESFFKPFVAQYNCSVLKSSHFGFFLTLSNSASSPEENRMNKDKVTVYWFMKANSFPSTVTRHI